MPDILSLSKARKARNRSTKEVLATANRVKFGRTRAEKEREAASKALETARADAHKRQK